jgi:3-deoxy-D-manno-octulosonic-acid transferase
VSWTEPTYEWAIRLARPWIEAGSVMSARVRQAVRDRRATLARMHDWAQRSRDGRLPLIWVHASSVGEALMAQAIIAELRQRQAVQVAFTYFSQSAERVAASVGADISTVLPWDVRRDMASALDALAPAVIVFVRTEVWPVLAREAARRKVGVMLVNAPLGEDSSRLRAPARLLLREVYRRLDAVAAVSAEDAARFALMGVAAPHLHVLGDARFDQVWKRVHAAVPDLALLDRLRDAEQPALVAGSTWPEDEMHLLPAVARVQAGRPLQLIIAPHQPTAAHVAALEQRLTAAGIAATRLRDVEAGAPLAPAIIVDRVGVLAQLYAAGSVAYVGGGFGRRGLHSVIEPAALGRPVLFGPRHGNAQEAGRLAASGGGVVVTDASSIERETLRLLSDEKSGPCAREFVRQNLGAADRIAELIEATLRRREVITAPQPTPQATKGTT